MSTYDIPENYSLLDIMATVGCFISEDSSVAAKCSRRDVKYCVTTQKHTGIPFVDQKKLFSLLPTLTYYTSFY